MGLIHDHTRRAEQTQAAKARGNEALARAAEAERLVVACLDELAAEQFLIALRERKDGDSAVALEAQRRGIVATEHARAARARVILRGVDPSGRPEVGAR